jgi:hypothetical protein
MTPKPDIEPVATLVERLRLWLVKRGQPDSGIRYESRNSFTDGAVTILHGPDATFVAENFHGEGARELASALLALEGERDALREALIVDLNVTDDELLRIRNDCEHLTGDIKIWARMLQKIVDATRAARSALSSSEHI